VSLFGECEDCGRSASLHFPPTGGGATPSVCGECHARREEYARDLEPSGVNVYGYESRRLEREHVDPTEADE